LVVLHKVLEKLLTGRVCRVILPVTYDKEKIMADKEQEYNKPDLQWVSIEDFKKLLVTTASLRTLDEEKIKEVVATISPRIDKSTAKITDMDVPNDKLTKGPAKQNEVIVCKVKGTPGWELSDYFYKSGEPIDGEGEGFWIQAFDKEYFEKIYKSLSPDRQGDFIIEARNFLRGFFNLQKAQRLNDIKRQRAKVAAASEVLDREVNQLFSMEDEADKFVPAKNADKMLNEFLDFIEPSQEAGGQDSLK